MVGTPEFEEDIEEPLPKLSSDLSQSKEPKTSKSDKNLNAPAESIPKSVRPTTNVTTPFPNRLKPNQNSVKLDKILEVFK